MRKIFTLFVAALCCASMFATEGALSGKFSTTKYIKVNNEWQTEWTQVQFAQGNLQYQASTDTWQFAASQWETIGTNNINISPAYSSWIDLFGWGTGNNPTNTSPNGNDYSTFVDWGVNPIINGGNTPNAWYTLSSNQWRTIINERPNAENLFGLGSVEGVNGVILLPDDWAETPSGIPAFKPSASRGMTWEEESEDFEESILENKAGYFDVSTSNHYADNTYTAEQWAYMQSLGAVFLPITGARIGTNYPSSFVDDGVYWTSNEYCSMESQLLSEYNIAGLYLYFGKSFCKLYPGLDKCSGCAVRLVQEVDGTEVPKVYTEYNATNHTLTYYYDTEREARTGITELYKPSDVRFTGYYDKVQKVVIDPSMKNAPLTSMAKLFYGGYNATTWDIQALTALTEIEGLGNLNTAGVTDMNNMFFQCESLTNLDLSTFNTSNVTNMNSMFIACKKLQTIDLSSFDITKVTDMRYMFNNCPALTTIYCNDDWSSTTAQSDGMFSLCSSLVGGNGTPYSSSHGDASYARPDEPENGKPGYFTKKGTEGIENIATPTDKARKVMMDGQFFIATPDGKIYNAHGAQVK